MAIWQNNNSIMLSLGKRNKLYMNVAKNKSEAPLKMAIHKYWIP